MNDLDNYRKEIDEIDQQIIELIAKRLEVVEKVGKYKKANKLPPLDQKRWQQVVESKKALAKELNINEELIEKIYNLIHKEALNIEN